MIYWERWQNDGECRESVRARLREWGAWSQGGCPNLDFPSHEHWTTPPEAERERLALRIPVDVDRAESSEFVISTMATTTREREAWLLLGFYRHRIPIRKLAKLYNTHFENEEGCDQVTARLNEAEWMFACLC